MDILKNSTNFSCKLRVNRKLHRYKTASTTSPALSSDASSSGAPGDRSGRSSGCRRRTGRAWPPCASCSGASVHPSGRTSSRSLPTCTCRASRLARGQPQVTRVPSLPKMPPSLWDTPNFLGTARAPQSTEPRATEGPQTELHHPGLVPLHPLPLCLPVLFKFLWDFGAFLAKNNF